MIAIVNLSFRTLNKYQSSIQRVEANPKKNTFSIEQVKFESTPEIMREKKRITLHISFAHIILIQTNEIVWIKGDELENKKKTYIHRRNQSMNFAWYTDALAASHSIAT